MTHLIPFLAYLAISTAQPLTEFEEKAIGFDSVTYVEVRGSNHAATGRAWNVKFPVEGKYQKKLSWPEFYETVGKKDLAESYRSKERMQMGVRGVGAVATGLGMVTTLLSTLGGLGVMVVPLLVTTAVNPGGSNAWFMPAMITGVAILVVGLAAGCVGTLLGVGVLGASNFIPVQPAEEHEIMRMADEYNQALQGADAAPAEKPAAAEATNI